MQRPAAEEHSENTPYLTLIHTNMTMQTLRRTALAATKRDEYAIAIYTGTPERRVIVVHVLKKMSGRGRDTFAEGFYDATLSKEERADLKKHVVSLAGPMNKFTRAGKPGVVDIEA